MSVVVEFMIPAEALAFGGALRTDPPVKLELERIVPDGESSLLYLWVSQGDFDAFEARADEAAGVSDLVLLDDRADRRLYRVAWEAPERDLVMGIRRSEGVILQAAGASTWTFQLRFPDEEKLTEFYGFVTEHDVALDVDNVYVLAEQAGDDSGIDLTMEQREALTMAVRRGFYKVPRGTTLAALADDLGVSNQAASERIRRGTDSVLRPVLLGEE